MTKQVSLKALRPRLPKIVDDIDTKMDRFIITRRGRAVALMMSVDDYESLLETIDILSNTRVMKRLKRAEADKTKDAVKTLEKIEHELGRA